MHLKLNPLKSSTLTQFHFPIHYLSLSPMASSASMAVLPSAPIRQISTHAQRARPVGFNKLASRSRVSMSVSVGSSQVNVTDDDMLFKEYKPTCAFLFPGQGAQTVGMGAEAQTVPAASELFQKANEILGFDLLDICINGPKEKLNSTVISQPAIYVTSLAAVEVLRAKGGQDIINSVDVTCGLSLGEYTALAFADAFSFEDGLKLVKLRGEAMQDAADSASSAMVSVIGLDSDKVQLLCDAANQEIDENDKVQIANYLCPGNYAVSGGVKGIELVEAKAKSFKARMTVRLAVAGAFHTRFMQPAVSRLEAALAQTEIRKPRIPVISNVDAQPHSDPSTIKNILARQVTSPVQWELSVKTLLEKGLKKGYELGPGKVIAGIVKRMDKTAVIENIGA
ncbi:hypothetical protein LUZ60_013095 [Juncus effusus]|nr:hypothetical protein LUZ60_013095 [Juncus effusus]